MTSLIKSALAAAGIAMFFNSCESSEIGESKDVNQETIYQQYRIEYAEAEANATLTAQFRFAGENGTTLVLTKPASFEFDGNVLKVDSSEVNGAYYEKSQHAK